MAAAISEDVIIEILCRLPVKSLLRFRCVSNQFRSIIDDPHFIDRHLQYRSLNRRRLIVQEEGTQSNFFSIDLDSADNAFKLELPFESWDSVHVIGSCDGLLAFSLDRETNVCLWNISTRKHRILPTFWSDPDIYCDIIDGFGYDVATDDYKLVRVVRDLYGMIEVTVYSLKANSWRRIENYPPYRDYTSCKYRNDTNSPLNNEIGVLVGGALNWVVVILDTHKCRVISFDLKDEKFCNVPLPKIWDEAEAEYEFRFNVVALEGCLCLSYFSPSESTSDIWVMKEYGVKESWTKLFTLSTKSRLGRDEYYFGYGIIAFTYSESGDKVLVYQVPGEVYWRELATETDESVEINEWPRSILRATIYMDSLVSPKVIDDEVVMFLGGRP